MKNIYLLTTLFLCNVSFAFSQNLISNPSFEQLDSCPTHQGQANFASNWFTTMPSFSMNTNPDLFSSNCFYSSVGTPLNFLGYQYPKNGNNYVGAYEYAEGQISNLREYIQSLLLYPLQSGKEYYVEYWISQIESAQISISNMGAYFSDTLVSPLDGDYFPVTPQIENPDSIILSDTMNWMKISGTFTAQGGEQYIVIGNFRPDSLTNIDTVSNASINYYFSYYYIDMVSVIPVDSLAGISSLDAFTPTVFPNPTHDFLTIDFGTSGARNCIMELYALDGRLLLKKEELMSVNSQIDLRQFPPGMYVLKIKSYKGERAVKVMKE